VHPLGGRSPSYRTHVKEILRTCLTIRGTNRKSSRRIVMIRARRSVEDTLNEGAIETLQAKDSDNVDNSKETENERDHVPGSFAPAMCLHRLRLCCTSGIQLCGASDCPAWMR
jgi:hypothetical protein